MSFISRRLAAAVQWRVDEAVARAVAAHRIEQEAHRSEQIAPVKRHVELLSDEVWAEISALKERFDFLRSEYDRLMPHIASLETRLADIAENGPESRGAGGDESALARERERVRLQLQAISQYEERLGRLEQTILPAR